MKLLRRLFGVNSDKTETKPTNDGLIVEKDGVCVIRNKNTLIAYRLFDSEEVDTQDITDCDEGTIMEIAEFLVDEWGEKATLVRAIHEGYDPSEAQLEDLHPLELIRRYGFIVFLNREDNSGEFWHHNTRSGGRLTFDKHELKTFTGDDNLSENLAKLLNEEGYNTSEAQHRRY